MPDEGQEFEHRARAEWWSHRGEWVVLVGDVEVGDYLNVHDADVAVEAINMARKALDGNG